ncbi:phage tail-like protein [Tamilnaduibacter salinus]|uniref:Phage tail-like protein n=1 Tax=Tamilnaduibacter salinus TaxID=1484056 RepID=A0A2U1CWE6_9GAMM|nr:phage tail protein [Tamilnaduibacter salinus]PVY76254.1 phage tail-like protein [Tamilnaduibacter salinus]
MAMFTVNTHRFDPYRDFKFTVVLDGKVIPGVTRVSPLIRRTEALENRTGTSPSHPRVMPGQTHFEPIEIERGLTHDPTFEEWAESTFSLQGDGAVSLKTYRRDLTIQLLNLQGQVVMAYQVYRCWVSEYQALPELDANGNTVAIERIVVEHEGWERDREVTEPAET